MREDAVQEIPVRDTGDVDEDGEPIMLRVMTAEEIRERDALNVANTASALRQRTLEYLAQHNGA